jgi:hypothetical protein
MAADFSRDSLLAFLREAAITGRMHPATARSRRKAAEALFAKLSDGEAADLRTLDLAALTARFAHPRDGGPRSDLLELYAERLRGALEDYSRFLLAPDDFVASVSPAQGATARDSEAARSGEEQALEAVHLYASHLRPDIIPVPLAPGRTVYLQGVPADLTSAEARKIARVIEALADGEDSES